MYRVKLRRLLLAAKLPTKGTKGSAYYDLYVAEDIRIGEGGTYAVTTGWCIEVPYGWFLDIRSRSGLACKGVWVANSPGIVDADFRGELKVIVHNASTGVLEVKAGDRMAQCALMPVHECLFEEWSVLSSTERGENGYGSTGR